MPAVGIAPAAAIALDAIGPDADVSNVAHGAFGRAEHRRRTQQTLHIRARIGGHIGLRNVRHGFMSIFPIGLGRGKRCDKGEKSDKQAFHTRVIVCNGV